MFQISDGVTLPKIRRDFSGKLRDQPCPISRPLFAPLLLLHNLSTDEPVLVCASLDVLTDPRLKDDGPFHSCLPAVSVMAATNASRASRSRSLSAATDSDRAANRTAACRKWGVRGATKPASSSRILAGSLKTWASL